MRLSPVGAAWGAQAWGQQRALTIGQRVLQVSVSQLILKASTWRPLGTSHLHVSQRLEETTAPGCGVRAASISEQASSQPRQPLHTWGTFPAPHPRDPSQGHSLCGGHISGVWAGGLIMFRPERGPDPQPVLTWYKVPFTLQTVQPVWEEQRPADPPSVPTAPTLTPSAPLPPQPRCPASCAQAVPTLPVAPPSCTPSEAGSPGPLAGHSLHFWLGQQAPSSWFTVCREPSGQPASAGQ